MTIKCVPFGNVDDVNSERTSDRIAELQQKLVSGTAAEKQQVLDIFREERLIELVPAVIETILDDTVSPVEVGRDPETDRVTCKTGWGRTHHQAATCLCLFAQKHDGLPLNERGIGRFSFANSGGVGSLERREVVYHNWKRWWEENREALDK